MLSISICVFVTIAWSQPHYIPGESWCQTAFPPLHWTAKEESREILHRCGQQTDPMHRPDVGGCLWWAIQSSLCFQPLLWWSPLRFLHLHSNHSLQHRCWKHKGNATSQGAESTTATWGLNSHHCTKVKELLKKNFSDYVHLFCLQNTPQNGSLLCQHLKFQHGLYPAKNLRLKCGEQGCPSSFCTYNGFRKHLNNVHSHHHDEQVDTNQEEDMQRHSDVELSSDEPTTSASLLQVPPVITPNSLDSMCGSIVAHIQASGVAESTVQTIGSSMEF